MRKRRSQQTELLPADDAHEFRAAVADVKPLSQPQRAVMAAARKPRAGRRTPRASAAELDADMPLIAVADDGSPASAAIAGDSAISHHRPGVRPQEMRRLRRALYPLEDELDLHGCTQTAARGQLADFILASRAAGFRCVRVIHGKGFRSGARGAVLKTAVDLWLRRHHHVLAFASAKAIDGGTGAVYVLLRG